MDITHSMYDNKLTANVSTFVSQHTMPRSWNTYAYRQALIHNPTEPVKMRTATGLSATCIFMIIL